MPDTEEFGDEVTDAQLVHHFDQRVAQLRDMVHGMARPVDGEPPLLSAGNLPVFNDYVGELEPSDLLELLSVSVMMLAEHERGDLAAELERCRERLRQALLFVRDEEFEGDTTWERDVEALLRLPTAEETP